MRLPFGTRHPPVTMVAPFLLALTVAGPAWAVGGGLGSSASPFPGATPASVCTAAPGVAVPCERFEFAEMHMGVRVRIVLYAPERSVAEVAATAAFARIAELEDTLSDYRPASELRRLEARVDEWVPVSDDLFTVMETAVEMARLTHGAFDPTVGSLSRLWRDARRTGTLPSPEAIEAARERTGWDRLALDPKRRAIRIAAPGVRLDLGGIAKGFILDQALLAAGHQGTDHVLLQAGGDIRVGAPPPGSSPGGDRRGWEIRIAGEEDSMDRASPHDPPPDAPASLPPELIQQASDLRHAALATSGGSVQFLEVDGVRYSHIVDPRTGLGLTDLRQATVIAPEGMRADALATALSVLGPADGAALLERFPEVQGWLHAEPAFPEPPDRP